MPASQKLCLAGTLLGTTMTTQVAAQTPPRIEEVIWPWIDSYCTFMKADRTFVFYDFGSWRFIFFTAFSEKGSDIMKRGFTRIDGQLRELTLESVSEINGSERRRYHSHDDPPYLVEVESETGKPGFEAVAYTGKITVSRENATSSVMFKGDCGV